MINNMMLPSARMQRSWGMIVVGGISAISGGISASKNRKAAKAAAGDAAELRRIEQQKLDRQKAEYKAMKFENPFSNMENVFEDLTVNQQQAEFQAQQGSQQRANIMQNLKGAAGSSGIAGLAQALANQGSLQTQQISASIGQQESRNQITAAKGAAAIQTYDRQGEQWVQQANMDRQATLLGMQMGETTGANLAQQQAQANQMNAQIAQNDANTQMISQLGTAAGNVNWGGSPKVADPTLDNTNSTDPFEQARITSDRRLKKNINTDTLGLEFINKLRPATYEFKPSQEVDPSLTEHYNAIENKADSGKLKHGLIAQEVKAALDEVGVDTFGGWLEGIDDVQRVAPADFIYPLINAIQELSAEVEQLKSKAHDKCDNNEE